MLIRVLGAFVFLLALAVLFLSVTGNTEEVASAYAASAAVAGTPFDSADWLHHRRVYDALLALPALASVLSGFALMLKRRWGLLLLASALLFLAVIPWVMLAGGQIAYAFEAPGWIESVILAALAAILTLVWAMRRRVDT